MTDPKSDQSDDENQRRKAEHEAAQHDHSVLAAVEDAFTTFMRPFAGEHPTEEDLEEQREETDDEERSS
jgi:hypothetical protein